MTQSSAGSLQWEEASLYELLCQRRGWTPEYLESLNRPGTDRLKDIDRMVDVLNQIRSRGLQITIAPDFDMDGITSGVLGYAGLKELGFDVNLHIPDYRLGHDLGPETVRRIAEEFPSTQVLLTCDNGVNSHQGIAAARARNWITLVTDHHQELEPGSQADLTVNPCRLDETYSLRGICGAHVLYQVLHAYAMKYEPQKIWAISLLRLFAGIGTVSDVMPVIQQNRDIIKASLSIARLMHVNAPPGEEPNRWGRHDPDPTLIDIQEATLLQVLRSEEHDPAFVRVFEGFGAVLKAFAIAEKIKDASSIDEQFYGFYLAPAMNSPRRTSAPLEPCFDVFLAPTEDERMEAMAAVIANNELRKQMTIEHIEKMEESEQPYAPWVYFSDAPSGMFGLLANQLMSKSGMPTIVMARPHRESTNISGSSRSPQWFDMISTVDPQPGMYAVGHQQACGVGVDSVDRLDDLIDLLETSTALALAAEPDAGESEMDLRFGHTPDCDASLSCFDEMTELIRRIELLRPFGHQFPEPVFEIVVDPTTLTVKRIGSEKQHLRLVTSAGMSMLWWNSAEQWGDALQALCESEQPQLPLRFSAKLSLNNFLGNQTVQAILQAPTRPLPVVNA